MTSDPVERYLLRASRLGRAARLRPLLTSEMFDMALRVYRTLGWTILRHSVVPTLFSVAGAAFLFGHVIPGFGWTQHGSTQTAQILEAAILFAVGVLVAGPLILVGVSLTTTFVAPLVADYLMGNVPNPAAAKQAQKRTAGRMLVVSLYESILSTSGGLVAGAFFVLSWWISLQTGPETMYAALTFMAAVAALVAGSLVPLWVASVHALAAPAAVIEDLPAVAAGRRSAQLMRKQSVHVTAYDAVWALYGVLALVALAIGAGAGLFTSMLGAFDFAGMFGLPLARPIVDEALGLLTWFLLLWVVVPVWAVTVTVLYFERRVRLEGYDIEALASDFRRADREGRFQL